MNCPKCGTQNPDDVQVCTSCNSPLAQPAETVKVKTSRLAIASFVLAILSPFAFFLTVFLGIKMLVITSIFAASLAFILGIISLAQIGLSAGNVAGKAFAAIAVAIPVVFYFVMCFLAVSARPRTRSVAYRMVCGSNLSGLGRSMLIYANDYDNSFPCAGGPTTKWGTTPNWQAENRIDAFGLKSDGTGGSATISSSLYLLIKYAEVAPKSFICESDSRTTMFGLSEFDSYSKTYSDLWDFGPEPTKHCSYSYHIPYSPYPLSTEISEPGQAVAADRNPWLDPYTDTTAFKWNDNTKTGGREDIRGYQKGNSAPHQREGQNVLFMDNHVYFEKVSFCGVNDDNIYTYWNGPDIQQGAPPVIGSQPADKLDSLLVNEPPTEAKK
jgi:hypothetical protein